MSRQTYDAATLAGPLSNQVAALKAAGAQVVAMATIPAATALAMLPAAAIGYQPQYVISNVGADAPTVGPLLSSFTPKGGGTAAQAAAPVAAERGHHRRLLRAGVQTSNPWVQVEKKLLQNYAPALYAKSGLDGNTQYGVALAYTVRPGAPGRREEPDPGRVCSRPSPSPGKKFVTPGFVPLSYSSSVALRIPGRRGRSSSAPARHRRSRLGQLDRRHGGDPVEVTNVGSGPVKKYTGKTSTPPKSLVSTS